MDSFIKERNPNRVPMEKHTNMISSSINKGIQLNICFKIKTYEYYNLFRKALIKLKFH